MIAVREAARQARALLVGRHRWGYATSRFSRYGTHTVAVHIYPPETPPLVRGFLHVARHWIPFGLVAAALTGLVTASVVPMSWPEVFAIKLVAVVVAAVTLQAITADVRARTKTLSGTRRPRDVDPDPRYTATLECWVRLREGEERLDNGAISPRQFAARWAAEYA
ncbi:DUF6611 family protein [Microbacterium aurantiacum]|uniref:DUF6611 family protein n=1 Tax=Microbacterium aurantiacum TaxID=162393 RepID=UPI003D71A460